MAEETLVTANGMFKETYDNEIVKFEPDFAILQMDVPFKEDEKIGSKHHKAVEVRRGGAVTWASGALAGTAFALNASIPAQSADAQFTPSMAVLPWSIAYSVITRSLTSRQAFENQFLRTTFNMKARMRFATELAMLYGGSSIGAIASLTGATTSRAYVISKQSWAVGIWAQCEGLELDAYDPTLTTKRNTNAAIVVSLVNTNARTVNVTGNAADLTATLANDVLVLRGTVGNQFTGLDVMTQNTGSLFNIDGGTYGVWRGNTYDVGNVSLKMAAITNAASSSVGRGSLGKRTCYLSHYAWNDLNTDEAALRRFIDDTRANVRRGTKSIVYDGPNGEIEIKQHPMVKSGEAFLVDVDDLERLGSTDVTFNLPGAQGSQPNFFQHMTGFAGAELRCMSDQCLAANTLSHHTKLFNINCSSLA